MREIRGYIIVGIITAVIIYMISPYMFGNRVQIKESSTKPLQNKAHSYADVFKKVNKSVVSIYTRKSTTSNNVLFIDPRKKELGGRLLAPLEKLYLMIMLLILVLKINQN